MADTNKVADWLSDKASAVGKFIDDTGKGIKKDFTQMGKDLSGLAGSNSDNRLKGKVPPGAEIKKRTRKTVLKSKWSTAQERRVKLELPPGLGRFYQEQDVENHKLLEPLAQSNGVIFPYTPQIITNNTANYSAQSPAHSNYPYQIYSNSQVSTINLFTQFTAQNANEARYVLACITFFRLMTKSFRNDDKDAGSPPPILRLSGHGQNLLPRIPVVVASFDLTLPNSVDYITIDDNPHHDGFSRRLALRSMDKIGSTISTDRIPTSTDISITLMPVYTREQLAEYSIDGITNGENLNGFL